MAYSKAILAHVRLTAQVRGAVEHSRCRTGSPCRAAGGQQRVGAAVAPLSFGAAVAALFSAGCCFAAF